MADHGQVYIQVCVLFTPFDAGFRGHECQGSGKRHGSRAQGRCYLSGGQGRGKGMREGEVPLFGVPQQLGAKETRSLKMRRD